MTLGEFREFTKDLPDSTELEMQMDDIINEEFFNVKADAVVESTQFYYHGTKTSTYKIVFYEEDSEEDGGGQ